MVLADMTTENATTLYLEDWAQKMSEDIAEAKQSIFMSALSMLLPVQVPQSGIGSIYRNLQLAVERGVYISILLSAPAHFAPASQSNLFAIKRLAADGIHARLISGARLLHAKTCTIDSRVVWIGSGNFTQQAATSNHEAYLRTVNAQIALRLMDKWKGLI